MLRTQHVMLLHPYTRKSIFGKMCVHRGGSSRDAGALLGFGLELNKSPVTNSISFVIWASIRLSGRRMYKNFRKSMAFKTRGCWSWFWSQNLSSVLTRGLFKNRSCRLNWMSGKLIPELQWMFAIRAAQRNTIQGSSEDLDPHRSNTFRFSSAKFSTLSSVVSCWSKRRWSHMDACKITSQRWGTWKRWRVPEFWHLFTNKILAWYFTCVPNTRLSVAWVEN